VVLGLPPYEVVLVPPRTISKTSSGKLRRAACKEAYLDGKLVRRHVPAWLQMIKLYMISAGIRLMGVFKSTSRVFYGIYIAFLLTFFIPPVWLGLLILNRTLAQQTLHLASRLFFRLALCPIYVNGKENITTSSPVIYVANHASWIDAIILIAILPKNVKFVGKQELIKLPIISTAIKKLGHIMVNRTDVSKSILDTKRIIEHIQKGNSIVFFPEGTFTYATGLRPFKSGAFKIAAETSHSIIPIALSGSRKILRDKSKLPRPGAIHISIAQQIEPKNKTWQEITRIQNLSRKFIAKHCGEDILDIIS